MRYLFCLTILLFGCNKVQIDLKEDFRVHWESYYNQNVSKSHYYISHLALHNDSVVFSIFSCGDSCSVAGIQDSKLQSLNPERIFRGASKFIEVDTNKKIWFNQELAVSYNRKAQSCEQWIVSDLTKTYKSSKYKLDKRGYLWEASTKGLNCFDGENWEVYFQNTNIYSICLDEQKNLYVSNLPEPDKKGIIMKYDYITWDTIIVCANNADWIPSMCFDRTSELWFGVLNRNVIGKEYGGGLFRFKDSKIDHFHINNSELPSNSVVDIAIDNFNNKWIGTYNGGLAKFCADGTWKLFNRENTDMPYNQSVEHIVIDKRNNVWLALWWTGLAKLTEGGK